MLEGHLDFLFGGKDFSAPWATSSSRRWGSRTASSTSPISQCFFWVSPPRKLHDLFSAIHAMKEQKPDEVVAPSARRRIPATVGLRNSQVGFSRLNVPESSS
jgi:hypothetical protein